MTQVSPLVFDCPRCGALGVKADFYGPCADCVTSLRSAEFGRAGAIDVVEYAPKMNVTPNFVATKD